MGTREQVPQSNLYNNKGRRKKIKYLALSGNISAENISIGMIGLKV